jgi:NAD-dependent SIR2 family protein deacetylase
MPGSASVNKKRAAGSGGNSSGSNTSADSLRNSSAAMVASASGSSCENGSGTLRQRLTAATRRCGVSSGAITDTAAVVSQRPKVSRSSAVSFESEHAKAALALLDADFLLVTAGAGFSNDSGLPVYKDIADLPAYHRRQLDYSDLCTPGWAQREPEIFFGFWGSCFNSYFDSGPHEGYGIINKWRDAVVGKHLLRRAASARTTKELTAAAAAKQQNAQEKQHTLHQQQTREQATKSTPTAVDPSPGFVFTSNVDCFFRRAGWDESHILEIHGNVERWQCTLPCARSRQSKTPVWELPSSHRFEYDRTTMRAPRYREDGMEDEGNERGYIVSPDDRLPSSAGGAGAGAGAGAAASNATDAYGGGDSSGKPSLITPPPSTRSGDGTAGTSGTSVRSSPSVAWGDEGEKEEEEAEDEEGEEDEVWTAQSPAKDMRRRSRSGVDDGCGACMDGRDDVSTERRSSSSSSRASSSGGSGGAGVEANGNQRAASAAPRSNFEHCPHCGRLARPNILMFDDDSWLGNAPGPLGPDHSQPRCYRQWESAVTAALKEDRRKRLVILELGAGLRVPTVRRHGERLLKQTAKYGTKMVRINLDFPQPRKPQLAGSIIALRETCLEALQKIDGFVADACSRHGKRIVVPPLTKLLLPAPTPPASGDGALRDHETTPPACHSTSASPMPTNPGDPVLTTVASRQLRPQSALPLAPPSVAPPAAISPRQLISRPAGESTSVAPSSTHRSAWLLMESPRAPETTATTLIAHELSTDASTGSEGPATLFDARFANATSPEESVVAASAEPLARASALPSPPVALPDLVETPPTLVETEVDPPTSEGVQALDPAHLPSSVRSSFEQPPLAPSTAPSDPLAPLLSASSWESPKLAPMALAARGPSNETLPAGGEAQLATQQRLEQQLAELGIERRPSSDAQLPPPQQVAAGRRADELDSTEHTRSCTPETRYRISLPRGRHASHDAWATSAAAPSTAALPAAALPAAALPDTLPSAALEGSLAQQPLPAKDDVSEHSSAVSAHAAAAAQLHAENHLRRSVSAAATASTDALGRLDANSSGAFGCAVAAARVSSAAPLLAASMARAGTPGTGTVREARGGGLLPRQPWEVRVMREATRRADLQKQLLEQQRRRVQIYEQEQALKRHHTEQPQLDPSLADIKPLATQSRSSSHVAVPVAQQAAAAVQAGARASSHTALGGSRVGSSTLGAWSRPVTTAPPGARMRGSRGPASELLAKMAHHETMARMMGQDTLGAFPQPRVAYGASRPGQLVARHTSKHFPSRRPAQRLPNARGPPVYSER